MNSSFKPNPVLDLVLERAIPVPPERVWAAWTEPELLMQWFTPSPWKTVAVDIDLRPGGPIATSNGSGLGFTARIEIEATPDGGTHYRAIAMHANEEDYKRHSDMGFTQGWRAALDQLVSLMSTSTESES
jgi:uncharacterized protein YndB with AHSA1/START domain